MNINIAVYYIPLYLVATAANESMTSCAMSIITVTSDSSERIITNEF